MIGNCDVQFNGDNGDISKFEVDIMCALWTQWRCRPNPWNVVFPLREWEVMGVGAVWAGILTWTGQDNHSVGHTLK